MIWWIHFVRDQWIYESSATLENWSNHIFIDEFLSFIGCSLTVRCFVVTAKKYDAFLASDTVIKTIPRVLGPGLNKAGKFPTVLSHSEKMEVKAEEVKATIKFQMKKVGFMYMFFTDFGSCLHSIFQKQGFCYLSTFIIDFVSTPLFCLSWNIHFMSRPCSSGLANAHQIYEKR